MPLFVLNTGRLSRRWLKGIEGRLQLAGGRSDPMARSRKGKAGKSRQDIFSPTRPGEKTQEGRRPGRPPVHDEAWTKVTVVLFNRQIVFLDRLAANIRAQSGAAISRAQLIRALLDATTDADVDLTAATSESDLKATLLARLGRYRMVSNDG
ncbi:MAG TPA: hypothetical protein VGI12_13285 [Vicinamibacterales bacterium]